jgi:hypothetical protein
MMLGSSDLTDISMAHYLLAMLLLCVAGATSAQTPETVFLERLTWTEVRDAMAAGKTTIIIPDRRHRAERSPHGDRQAQRARRRQC